jgi:hypothetical protein
MYFKGYYEWIKQSLAAGRNVAWALDAGQMLELLHSSKGLSLSVQDGRLSRLDSQEHSGMVAGVFRPLQGDSTV